MVAFSLFHGKEEACLSFVRTYSTSMRILGIESSCDETAAAIVENGVTVLSNCIASSRESFLSMGGVIPEDAARQQVRSIVPVIDQALAQAKLTWKDIDAIAVTRGPGLLGSLLVGTIAARACASVRQLPLIGVHHTMGHLSSVWLGTSVDKPQFPCLTLSVSGGHTELWLRQSHTQGTILGRTRDDAAGEALDKGAALLGLAYPGGPAIAQAAADGKCDAYPFPLPLHREDTLDYSFSGLKTSLRYLIRDLGDAWKVHLSDIAASYEQAIVLHLCDRMKKALAIHRQAREIHVVGGVSANLRFRNHMDQIAKNAGIALRMPLKNEYCTDNAAMIAAAGHFLHHTNANVAYAPFRTSSSEAFTAAQ